MTVLCLGSAFSDEQRAQYSPVKPHVLKMMESPKVEGRDLFGARGESSQTTSSSNGSRKRKVSGTTKNGREIPDKKRPDEKKMLAI